MRTIGVISPFISGVFLGEVFAELLKAAPALGVRVVAVRTGEQRKSYTSHLALDLCEGWIPIVGAIGPDLAQTLVASGRPVVSIAQDLRTKGCSSVHSDNAAGVRQALDYWYSKGHRSFACLGYRTEGDIGERMDAFLSWVEDHGLDASPERVVDAPDYGINGGWEAARTLDERGLSFTALFCGHDQNAAGAIQFYRDHGAAVPEIIGYDNSVLARDPDFDLSSLDQDFPALAREALIEVLHRIQTPSDPPRTILVPPKLVVRGSTGDGKVPLAGSELEVDPGRVLTSMLYSDELNRFLHGGRTRAEIRPLLVRLEQHARGSLFADLADGQYRTAVAIPDSLADSGPQAVFGRALLDRDPGSTVVVVPIEASGRIESALAIAFPQDRMTNPVNLALVTHQLELAAFAIERSTLRDQLERQVEERTRQLERVQADLLQAARVGVVGPLVNAVAHHLNTPLGNGILALGHLRPLVSDPEALPTLDLLERSLARASLLVQRFRQLVDVQVAALSEEFEAGPVVKAACLGGAAGAVRVEWEGEEVDPVRLHGSVAAFYQVVEALMSNAAVHGASGGQRPVVKVRLVRVDGGAILEVADNGPGMAADLAQRVFEPFFTTRLSDSCGLGLTLVYNVVTTLFAGTVEVKTGPGSGFSVTCRFPQKNHPPPGNAGAEGGQQKPQGPSPALLSTL